MGVKEEQMQTNLIKLKKLVDSKKAILINNKFVFRTLAFSDVREFCEAIHSWGYSRDFTYQTIQNDWQRFLRTWIKETYLD